VAALVKKRLDAGVRPEAVLVLVRGKGEIRRIAEAMSRLGFRSPRGRSVCGSARERWAARCSCSYGLSQIRMSTSRGGEFMRASDFGEEVVLTYHEQRSIAA